ncbi:MAG TPA: CHAT domain-containing tetratricopeptide repeat protein [Cyclobacteriaceae bacterium]|nr:CHAT domain-containing tetratricopeptide repeat protein [Cyclobacteriaceae bacterium]
MRLLTCSLVFLACVVFCQCVHAQNESWTKLDERGTALFNEQKYDESLEVFLQAVDAAKREFGANHGNYAGTLKSVGILYYYLQQAEESEKYFNEALVAYERISGKFTADYEDTLHGLTYLYSATGEQDKLLAITEVQLNVSDAVHGKGSEEHLGVQKQIANLYMDRQQYAKAEAVLLQGHSATAGSAGVLHGDFCVLLFQLYAERNLPAKGEPYFEEAKRIRNKAQQELWKTMDFKNMTWSYEIDDPDAKAAYWEEQAKEYKEADPESVNYARVLINLATVYQSQEELKKAEPLLMQAKKVIEENGSPGDMGTICGSLGYFYDMMGNAELSSKFYTEGLAYTRVAGGREDINYGTACHNQSMYRWKIGDLPACELYEKIALLIYASQQSGFTYYASASTGLAQLYDRQKNYSKAEAYQMEALKITEMSLGRDHYTYAIMAAGLARIYEKQKKLAEAEALFVNSKTIMEKVFGKEHIQYAAYCQELAQYYVRQQQFGKAVPLLREATSIKLKRVQNNFGGMSESEKKDLYRYGRYYIDNYAYSLVKDYAKNHAAAGDLYDLMIATKGLIFQSSAKTKAAILGSGNKKLIQSFRDWTAQREHLAKVYALSLEQRKTQGIDIAAMEADINRLEKELMTQASELSIAGVDDTKSFNWKQLKSKLKSGEAAVEIVRTSNEQDIVYGAVIVTGGNQNPPDLVVLPRGSELETRDIRLYHNSIQLKLSDTSSYRKYWGPIASKLTGIKKVYFSPAGVYHQLSLPTLGNKATGKFLLDETDVIIVGNTGDLLRTKRIRGKASSTYLMGYPDYNGTNAQTGKANNEQRSAGGFDEMNQPSQRFFDRATGKVVPLPGTLKEVETIQALLKSRNVPVSLLTHGGASEDQLKKISNPGVLHIATHGFFMKDQHLTEAEQAAGKKTQDPLLRSGLLLAGCEQTLKGHTREDTEDGILTAYEAMNLYLDNTDLVVLSACETGVGEIDNGEGVYGLQRAFQQAGSRYVLVSLWKVDDEATGFLMSKFYEMQSEGVAYAEAFLKAREQVKEKYKDPYYWGAFVLIGD